MKLNFKVKKKKKKVHAGLVKQYTEPTKNVEESF